jgi:hypothetical protein
MAGTHPRNETFFITEHEDPSHLPSLMVSVAALNPNLAPSIKKKEPK